MPPQQHFVLLQHCVSATEYHWDIFLENGAVLAAWSLSPDQKTLRRLPDHRRFYLDYEGPISDNRGFVRQMDSGTYEQSEPDHIRLHGNRFCGTLQILPQSLVHLQITSMETILFFSGRKTENAERQKRENQFLNELENRCNGTVYVLPHLYDCAENGAVAQALRRISGPITVFSRLPARATLWLLRKMGVQEQDVRCYDLTDETTTHFATNGSAKMVRIEEPTKHRWYPVLDYSVCQHCLECVNYCMFGVYGIGEDNRPLVEQPDACRDGCPACSRLCPANAIMFPEYDDPVISGKLQPAPTQPTLVQWTGTSVDSLDQLIDQAEE